MPLYLKKGLARIQRPFEQQSTGVLMIHALAITVILLGIIFYWFAIADRYQIFLYNHLDAIPFDSFTLSRYLMAGLVANGVIVVIYTAFCWFVGSLARIWRQEYVPPSWFGIWLLCLPFLSIGIPAITMTVNKPTLPASIALGCTFTAIAGLALALSPGRLAAQRPGRLLCTGLMGCGLVPMLLFFRAIELPSRDMLTDSTALLFAGGSVLIAIGWFAGCVWGSRRFKVTLPSSMATICAAFIISYLFLPLFHHLFFTPHNFRYITSSSNFFAFSISTQAMCWLALVPIVLIANHSAYRSS